MDEKADIVVIGGGPAGSISALTARNYYPDKKILLIKNAEEGVTPCGIPYMFFSLKNPDENKMGLQMLEKNNIEIVVDEVVKIDRT
ncbi:MAG: pyridine nucleotide-disulfide oxidoreductase, partial [Thermoplasmata archaeon]